MASLALVWWTSRRFYGEAVAWVCALLGATCFSLYEVFHRGLDQRSALDGGGTPVGISSHRLERIVIAVNLTLSWILLIAIPFGAWRSLGRVELLWPTLPVAATALVLALRHRRGFSLSRLLGTSFACSAIGSALVLVAIVPPMDEQRSYRAFFEEIRLELDGRELCTAMKDELRLPLMDFYLGSPLELLDAESLGFEKLRGPAPVGFFLTPAEYQAAGPSLSGIPHRVLRGARGKKPLVVVVNSPPLENEIPPRVSATGTQ
jgi:hypothetical protein